jgi:hypothetical protein
VVCWCQHGLLFGSAACATDIWLLCGSMLCMQLTLRQSCRTPSFLVSRFLQQLKLTDESEQEFPDLAIKINAVRVEATHTANAR